MPYDLKNRNVLITGGSRGLGAVIVEKFAAEGCNVAINYANRREAADEVAEKVKREYGVKAVVLQGDAGDSTVCANMVKETIKAFGGIDVIVGNAGYTKFSKFGDLNALPEEEWDKCWSVNVKGQLALLREAMPTFNSNPEGGAFIVTSSIAGACIGGSSMAYCVTKAAQLHLVKCLASTQGPKARVNAILPGLLLTEWGYKYSPEAIEANKQAAKLKKETDLDDCANMFVSIAKNTSMTGQCVGVESGLLLAYA